MFKNKLNTARINGLTALVFLGVAGHAGAASTDIAPAPLAKATTSIVKPNLMFILDDSASMNEDQMPDWIVDEEVCKDYSTTGVDYLRTCSFGDPAYNNSRSNAVYYNPDVRYRPPVNSDGTFKKSYNKAADWKLVPNDGYGIQFTGTVNMNDNGIPDYVWCNTSSPSSDNRKYSNVPNSQCKLPIDSGQWRYPNSDGTQYRYRFDMLEEKYPYYYVSTQAAGLPDELLWCDTQDSSEPERGLGDGTYPPPSNGAAGCSTKKDSTNPFNGKTFRYPKYGTWKRIEIKSTGTYNRASSRTDCTGAVGAGGCSYTEEMTNFANWWAYYRTRLQAMKSATGHAFISVDSRFRVGFITITPEVSASVDPNQFLKISDFDKTQKDAWFTKLYKQDAPGGGGTPLREALSRVGRYYANVTDGINKGMSDDPIQYSCQQNFAILTTDGYWTNNAGDQLDGTSIGDHDSDSKTAPLPLLDKNKDSGTLADVAQYYYINDLRPDGDIGALGMDVGINNVPGKPAGDPQNDSAAWQHMTTFTVGMGVDGTLQYEPDYRTNPKNDFLAITSGTTKWPTPVSGGPTAIDDLWHAAVNGRAKYFSAKDPTTLSSGLTEALVGINATIGSSSAAATSNLEPIAGDNYVYIANYETVFWNGDVEARTIDLATGAVNPDPVWTPSAQGKLDQLAAQTTPGGGNRKIYFFRSGATDAGGAVTNLVEFKDTLLNATEAVWFTKNWVSGADASNPNPALSQWPTLTAFQQFYAGGAKYMVDFLRGDSGQENRTANIADKRAFRERTHVLGDIVNSQPVYVRTVNADYKTDVGYSDFKACINDGTGGGCPGKRNAVLYVAANDGMLHAFDANTGNEIWAFIPRRMMPKLYRLADMNYANMHTWFVDGSPIVGDVYDSSTSTWKTILVGGYNGGGRGFYALDITNPSTPKALWEVTVRDTASCPSATVLGVDKTDCDLGLSYGNPVITKLTDGKWVVLVTSGYNNVAPGDGKGYLYVLNPMTGVIQKKIKAANATQGIDPGDKTTPLGLAKINNWVENTLIDNTTLRVYAGDLEGNVWRFDPAAGTAYVIAVLKDAPTGAAKRQPVTTKPELGEAGGIPLVSVGTGRYLGVTDLTNTQTQSIYTFKDDTGGIAPAKPIDGQGPTVVEQVMTDSIDDLGTPIRTITNNVVDLDTKNGWRVDLPLTGERVNVNPTLQLGTLVVATNIPENNACVPDGISYLNYFDYKSGSYIGSSGTNVVGTKIANSLAVGISVVRLPNGKTVAIVTTSENKHPTLAPPFQAPGSSGRRSSWRELLE